MFDSLRGLDPTVFFTPGAKGYLLLANPLNGRQSDWSYRVPVRIRAMLLAGDRLLTAGPPDVVDPQDPLGAFEGRKGGVLHVVNAATGERLAEQRLPSPPVFNGARRRPRPPVPGRGKRRTGSLRPTLISPYQSFT